MLVAVLGKLKACHVAAARLLRPGTRYVQALFGNVHARVDLLLISCSVERNSDLFFLVLLRPDLADAGPFFAKKGPGNCSGSFKRTGTTTSTF